MDLGAVISHLDLLLVQIIQLQVEVLQHLICWINEFLT